MLAEVAGDGAVGGFGFHGLAIGRQKDRSHQAERAIALGHDVGLDVAIIVLAGPDKAAGPLQGRSDHVVDQTVFIGDAGRLEGVGEFGLEDFFENILEAPVIGLEDGVLGRQVDRELAVQTKGQRRAGEVADGIVQIIHGQGHARAWILEDFLFDHLTVVAFELDGQTAGTGNLEVGGLVLVAKGVAADDDGLGPAGHQTRHVLADDRLAEDHAAQDVADGAVRRLPHFLEVKFLHPGFVRGDGGAFDAHAVLLDRIGAVNGDLVVGLVALFNAQVVIFQVDIEIGEDQLVLDQLPDDPGHFIAVDVDHGVGDFDLGHALFSLFDGARGAL